MVIATLAVATLPSPTSAENGRSDRYFRLSVGFAHFSDTVFSDVNCRSASPSAYFGCGSGPDGNPRGAYGDFGTSPLFEGAVGFQLTSRFRGEIALNHLFNVDFDGQANFLNVAINKQPVSGPATSTALMLNGYFDLFSTTKRKQTSFAPYLSAGLGLSYNEIEEVDYEFPTLGVGAKTIVPSGRSTNFAWSIGIGFTYQLREDLVADLGYRYTDRGSVKTDTGDIRIVRTNTPDRFITVGGTEADFETHELTLGFRYSF